MDTILEQYLDKLRANVGQMAGLVEDSLQLAIKALAAKDPSRVEKIFQNEGQINRLHKDIDHMVFKLLARQSPVASDLRLLLSISKINVDLERMGDLCRSMAYSLKDYFKEGPILLATEIPKMGDLARSMVARCIEAFLTNNEELSREVLALDDRVDEFRDRLVAELKQVIKQAPDCLEGALCLFTIIRNLERIGDHATNVAEDVVFSLTGKDIRHSHQESSSVAELKSQGGSSWKDQ